MIVAYQNQIVMERTLEAGLARLFGGAGAPSAPAPAPQGADAAQPGQGEPTGAPASQPAPSTPPGLESLAAEAQRHYARAIEAQRAGDWATYGDEIKQLGATLERMRSQQGAGRPR